MGGWGGGGGKITSHTQIICKATQLYAALLNYFDRTFVLAFYNSFLKTKLNCDRENTLILNVVFKGICCLA